MSNTSIFVERVRKVETHPNADRLDIVQVGRYQVVTGIGQWLEGDVAAYFPPDCLIPSEVGEELGMSKYLKHATYPGEYVKSACRVGAVRLRGVPSYGFIAPVPDGVNFSEINDHFRGAHYEPPIRCTAEDADRERGAFPKYTSIEHYQRYGHWLKEGEPVVITEKLHGTNCRMGYVNVDGLMTFVAGSHNVNRKYSPHGLYWGFLTDDVRQALVEISNHQPEKSVDVVLYGEIIGPGIQDMAYGVAAPKFRAFDMMMGGNYVDYHVFCGLCDLYGIERVPHLYEGPFSEEVLKEHTDGPTTFEVKTGFAGREGCVVKPTKERMVGNQRVILKSVSVDYLSRKNAKDLGEL